MASKSVLTLREQLKNPIYLGLLVVTLLGAGFRLYHPNWNLDHSIHPDERNILNATSQPHIDNGFSVSFFAYGQLPAYLYRATGELISPPLFMMNFFHGSGFGMRLIYWIFLLALFGGVLWSFSREKWKVPAFGTSVLLFGATLTFKFFNIFCLWFAFLEGQTFRLKLFVFQPNIPILPLVCFFVVAVVSLVISFLAARMLEMDWIGLPFYIAMGILFLFGIVPGLLPEAWHCAQIFTAFSFTLGLLVLSVFFAWHYPLGRISLGLFSLWSFFASFDHGWGAFTDNGTMMVIGHVWAAIFSSLTILAVYVFVEQAYRHRLMALVAAASFAFSAVSIEQAHYCITESFITLMFVVIALCAYRISQEGSWKNYLLAGAAFGLAMAAKTSSLYYVFIIVAGHLLNLSKTSAKDWEKADKKLKEDKELFSVFAAALLGLTLVGFIGVGWQLRVVIQQLFSASPQLATGLWIVFFLFLLGAGFLFSGWGLAEFRIFRAQAPQWIKLTVTGGLSFLLFFLFSPWSLLNYTKFMESMNYEWDVVSAAGACYVLQFKDTPRYLYHLQNLVSVELWWPLGITVVLGMVWVFGRFFFGLFKPTSKNYLIPMPFTRGKGFSLSLADLLVLSWFVPYFGFIGSWNTKFIRYMVPLVPAFCIFGARLLTDLSDWAKTRGPLLKRWASPILLAAVLGPSLFYSLAYMHVYTHPHPWFDASVWISKNVKPGSVIATDTWDDGLPQDLNPDQDPRLDKSVNPGNYGHLDVDIYSPMGNSSSDDNDNKKNYYANSLQNADYISLATKKLWYTLVDCTPQFRPHGYNVYPVTSRYFRLLWSGLLGYRMVGEFHNFPSLFGWEHPDDMAEETFSVYDHPRVYLFQKVKSLSREQILELLSTDDYVRDINRDTMRTLTPDNIGDFITKHDQKLEQEGLLQKLNSISAPVTQASAAQAESAPAPPAAAVPLPPVNAPVTTIVPAPIVEAPNTVPGIPDGQTLKALENLADHPVVENNINSLPPQPEETAGYQWRAWFSWLALLLFLGWITMPVTVRLFSNMPSGAYSLSKVIGFLVFTWIVWLSCSEVTHFTLATCWIWLTLLTGGAAYLAWKDQKNLKALTAKWGRSWLIQEAVFVLAFLAFTVVKIYCPHIHDPSGEGYNGGGEAGMDFGFLASIVRGESFPPRNMWMAGQPIGYPYYFGHLMMGVLTKTLGLVPAVTYNLALITLFALVFSCAFGLAYSLSGKLLGGWLAGFLCAVASNLTGVRQYLSALNQCLISHNLSPLSGITYDFFGPSRVIPNSINEFPYFSVLYGDMHSHTLSMPFDMLFIGIVASLFLTPLPKLFTWKGEKFLLLMAGFVMGSLVFLNTWDILTALALLGLSLVVRSLTGLDPKAVRKGLEVLLGVLVAGMTLLGWFVYFLPGMDTQALGGSTLCLVLFLLACFIVSWALLFSQKKTKVLSRHLLEIALSLGVILAAAFLFWAPNFLHFTPQQNKILWVIPSIRSSLNNFVGIYGFFLSILLVSFVLAFPKEILNWTGKAKKIKDYGDYLADRAMTFIEELFNPGGDPVLGMLSVGGVLLALFWGASWVHWSEPRTGMMLSLTIATFAAGIFMAAVYFRNRWQLWLVLGLSIGLWSVLLMVHAIHFYQDSFITLGLGLFSVLWLLGFFFLGLAVKVFKDRPLSFSYVLVALLFLLLAVLEVFAVSEFLGGEWMRNNSLFKFGIHAWIIASVATGSFFPRILGFVADWLRNKRKETPASTRVWVGAAGVLLFVLFKLILTGFSETLQTPLVYIMNIVLILGLSAWGVLTGLLEKTIAKAFAFSLAALGIVFSMLSLLPQGDFGSIYNLIQHWCGGVLVDLLFPVLLALLAVSLIAFLWEKQKNVGARMAFTTWGALALILGLSVAVYPLAASVRKCHGFLDATRQRWVGYAENPTLNGLEYIRRENPNDDAAIRFLNRQIPDQPCLAEFVGAGYNSWGSRFSIFTGLPALMGWDSHVHEWVGKQLDNDIYNRKATVDQIFSTPDPVLAKSLLDAYGVRLVMVGTVERNGAGGKPGYPEAGLDKFSGILRMIYKNPGVEIYYNPPPVRN